MITNRGNDDNSENYDNLRVNSYNLSFIEFNKR